MNNIVGFPTTAIEYSFRKYHGNTFRGKWAAYGREIAEMKLREYYINGGKENAWVPIRMSACETEFSADTEAKE